jgi:hypothetical protein
VDQRALVIGLGALGLAGLATWALWPKRKALGGLGDEYRINQSAKFYVKKYGISPEDARRLVMSPQRSKIDREIEEWRAQYGYPEANSPLVRGYVRDRVRALAGRKVTHRKVNGSNYETHREAVAAIAEELRRKGATVTTRYENPEAFSGLGATHMLQLIASESKTPQEYARRAEAWAATEAKPPSLATIAKAYRKGKPAEVARLLRRAKAARLAQTQARWRGYVNQPEEAEDLID